MNAAIETGNAIKVLIKEMVKRKQEELSANLQKEVEAYRQQLEHDFEAVRSKLQSD